MKKGKRWVIPIILCVFLLGAVALCIFVPARDVSQPNYEFVPEAQMVRSPAYHSFAPNPNFADGLTLRTPPAGVLARGSTPLHYAATLEDALRAGEELKNPFRLDDAARRERGATVFTNFCQCCHGPFGQGNGPVALGGFPPPASLLAERAVQMKDGQMFHVLTYGQNNMPSAAAQLSEDDRWSVIVYVRVLQMPTTPGPGARMQAVAQLFNEKCSACHGRDGAGNPDMRKLYPLIPNFTSLAWQMSQTEVAIVNQIDYGTAPMMPAFRYNLKPQDVVGLAVYVRSFAAQQPGAAPSAPPPSQLTPESLYGTSCYRCHDLNGKGDPTFKQIPVAADLPDFTDPFWQKSRTDEQLTKSILEGTGPGKLMVSRKDELGAVDVKDMVALVRRFKDGKYVATLTSAKPGGPVLPPVPTAASLDPPTRDAAALGGLLGSPSGAGPLLAYSEVAAGMSPPGVELPPPPVTGLSDEEAARVRVGQTVFSQYCMVCHGHDGTGSPMRQALPQIPDFTSSKFPKDWPDDFKLRSIILTGNNQMPANVGRVTADQARDLVDFIRTFRPESERPVSPAGSDAEFDKAVGELEKQLADLHKQMQDIKGPP